MRTTICNDDEMIFQLISKGLVLELLDSVFNVQKSIIKVLIPKKDLTLKNYANNNVLHIFRY